MMSRTAIECLGWCATAVFVGSYSAAAWTLFRATPAK
jgi:hypothetical protein